MAAVGRRLLGGMLEGGYHLLGDRQEAAFHQLLGDRQEEEFHQMLRDRQEGEFHQLLGDRLEGGCPLMGGTPEAVFHQLMEDSQWERCKWQGTEHSHPEVQDHSLDCIQVAGCSAAAPVYVSECQWAQQLLVDMPPWLCGWQCSSWPSSSFDNTSKDK